jgi:hypothetical protein
MFSYTRFLIITKLSQLKVRIYRIYFEVSLKGEGKCNEDPILGLRDRTLASALRINHRN